MSLPLTTMTFLMSLFSVHFLISARFRAVFLTSSSEAVVPISNSERVLPFTWTIILTVVSMILAGSKAGHFDKKIVQVNGKTRSEFEIGTTAKIIETTVKMI